MIGIVSLIAFPILMAKRPNPLIPLSLFKSRAFATINLATFFIYGALYVTLSYSGLALQNALGYTALAAGASGLPTGVLLSVLSTRVGTLSGRIGARPFLLTGPVLMAFGLLWSPGYRRPRHRGRRRSRIRRRSSRRSTSSSTSCRPSSCSGSGSRSSSHR